MPDIMYLTPGNTHSTLVPLWANRWVTAFLAVWAIGHALAGVVISTLPDNFTPGTPFSISLAAAPDSGTHVYGVEETPPTGWRVGLISHGGVFDAGTGKIKWGPFTDALSRVLSYDLIPPANASGTHTFSGLAVFDVSSAVISGQRQTVRFPGTLVRTIPLHYLPGTSLPVALAAAPAGDVGVWAVEEVVPEGWNVTSISEGGGFDALKKKVKWGPYFDASPRNLTYIVTPPGSARSSGTFAALTRFDASTRVDSASVPIQPSLISRNSPATYLPGAPFTVALNVTPALYVQAVALEESLPDGWIPSNINGAGVWDQVHQKIKWGPYIGSPIGAKALSYQLTPAPGSAVALALLGSARFDDLEISTTNVISRLLVHSENTVVRSLPATYQPGLPLTVTVVATPIDTGLIYAIEEAVPSGWAINSASHGGTFDSVNHLVKWGPFFDGTATVRSLTYQATPPTNAFGTATFHGTARFDQVALPISGSTELANAPGTVTRALPARYNPGSPFIVTLTASPVPGVETYAVEEQVPAGWTISGISDGGAFDAINQKLKWGPFLDRNRRPLTYTVTPTVGATGTNRFSGQGWFNREASPVDGSFELGPNRVPVATPDSFDRPLSAFFKVSVFAVLANDTDADSDFLNLISVSATSGHGGEVKLDWPWIYYTPPTGFSGIDTFTYIIGDGHGGTATATVTLNPIAPPGASQNIVSLITLPGGTVRVRFTGVPGFTYHVQTSSNVSTWTPAADRIANAVGQFEYDDAGAITTPIRFYRTLWP
ncbi:MAG TPA: Ig-like domain-containing protein [Candidatus Limnocylindria bacterium]|nr:Ig-like domain-containing protein [Candidatus Limnocylindria bacterium]